MNGIATLHDVEAIEAQGAPHLPASTYELIARGAGLAPDAPALSFFLTVDDHCRPETWTYRDLLGRITQTANFFHRLGAIRDTVIAYVLPNRDEARQVLGSLAPPFTIAREISDDCSARER